MAQKCVHKSCGKVFSDPAEPCVYHPGPPVFHEGQKGWQCCKPRVLTFDEFLSIPPCTTGTHSTVDDTPAPPPKPAADTPLDLPAPRPVAPVSQAPAPQPMSAPPPVATPEPETEDDDPSLTVAHDAACRRRSCGARATAATAGGTREGETCVHHPGHPVFHEGTKGWTCCKKRVLEFDEFMQIEGCTRKERHLFVGSGRKDKGGEAGEKKLESVRHDFYQTPTLVHATYFLKKIDKAGAKVEFHSPNVLNLDLPTADQTRYAAEVVLFGAIDPAASSFKIMGTKLDVTLAKADGASWAVLQADDPRTGGIIQTGSAGRA